MKPAVWRKVSDLSAHEVVVLERDFDLPLDRAVLVVVLTGNDLQEAGIDVRGFRGRHWRDASAGEP